MMTVTVRRIGGFVLVMALPAAAVAAPTGVRLDRVGSQLVGTRQVFSSTELQVSWTPGTGETVHHFLVAATDGVQGTTVSVTAASGATTVTLTGLKAATDYAVVVTACRDAACQNKSAAAAVTGSTDTEYWQLQGTGHAVDGLTKAVSDGNARLSATRFGSDAGAMANRVQLYYGPMRSATVGRAQLAAAVASGAASTATPETYLTFTSRSGSSGLTSPSSSSTWISDVATGEGVPVTRAAGGFVRLFFEATGADGKTRILAIDSKDGYFGLDFNAGAEGTCTTAADYSTGGGCEPMLQIGVEGDADGNKKFNNARQFKVGWPTLDSPHWDMAPGTFMVFTTDEVSGCSDYRMNHGYAVWDGARWVVQYQANGCPKLFTSAQAAFPMHSGGVKYRLYYGDPSLQDGRGSSQLPFLGPKKLIYADGTVSGDAGVVDFEDWESQDAARDVVFMWPDGTILDARAEGFIDDYHFLTPTGSLDLQVMYITVTDGAIPPIAATAVLRNP